MPDPLDTTPSAPTPAASAPPVQTQTIIVRERGGCGCMACVAPFLIVGLALVILGGIAILTEPDAPAPEPAPVVEPAARPSPSQPASASEAPEGQVEVVRVRVEDTTIPTTGVPVQAICADFKNIGSKPIREIWGNVTLYDADGSVLPDSARGACLYAVADGQSGIAAGATHSTPTDSGWWYILTPIAPRAAAARITVTRVVH